MPVKEGTITICGRTMPISEYIEEQERKEKKNEIEQDQKEIIRKARMSIGKSLVGRKKLWLDSTPYGVITTKRFTQEEIKKEGFKMAKAGYIGIEKQVLRNIIKSPQHTWATSNEFFEGLLNIKQATKGAAFTRVYQFLSVEKLMTRKKEKGTVGYLYSFLADTSPSELEINVEKLYNDFKKWNAKQRKIFKEKKRQQSIVAKPFVEKSSKTPTDKAKISEGTIKPTSRTISPNDIEKLSLAISSLTNIKIEVKISVLFGWIK